jgi:hypothetical protein
MSEPDRDDLIKFAAVLDEFAASQRALALGQAKRQRVTLTTVVGTMQVQFETLVDEGSAPEEIFEALAPIDTSIERLRAKVDLSKHLNSISSECGLIEMTARKLSEERARFHADNEERNQNRRTAVVLTGPQLATLAQLRREIDASFVKIEGFENDAAECRRVVDGEETLSVLESRVAARLDRLRGARQDAA